MEPLVYLIAGEPSGDVLGARLIEGLRELTGGKVRITGIGGPLMEAEGLDSLFPIDALSIMGIVEVVPRIPKVLGLIRRTVADIRERQPDVVVAIDSKAFSYRVARKLKPAPCPVIQYVAPTVWAWKPWRAKHLADVVDRVLLLFPFEKPYFNDVGLDAVFVGHPASTLTSPPDAGALFRRQHDISAEAQVVCLLPGSRGGEVTQLLPVFQEAVGLLEKSHPGLRFLLPTVPRLAQTVRQAVDTWSQPVTVLTGDDEEKRAAFAASDVALAASGTVTLELAAAGLPGVITYCVHPLTALIVRRMIRIPYAAMVNIIEGRDVMPEYLQENCDPAKLSAAVGTLLDDATRRADQQAAMAEVMKKLGRGGEAPNLRAARAVLDLIPAKTS
ncbi:MAG: lipid-A-disaccharide synthase [Pseudomonadota bacterium]